MDPIIETMLLLKNNWSLTGDLSSTNIAFSTRFYDETLRVPQLVILPEGSTYIPPIDCGASEATYGDFDQIGFHIFVKPLQDSNTSLGWAKNAVYRLCRESERILKSGSIMQYDDDSIDKVIFISGWETRDKLNLRPPLFVTTAHANIIKYKKGV